jgi:hypothetical protein
MLINLSNHPATRWTETQLAAAVNTYSTVTDMPFPNIPPAMNSAELDELTAEYLKKILDKDPQSVHIMGEMTFTFRLVLILKKMKIPCIASTTNRTVEEKDGKKIVQFEFVQFREY